MDKDFDFLEKLQGDITDYLRTVRAKAEGAEGREDYIAYCQSNTLKQIIVRSYLRLEEIGDAEDRQGLLDRLKEI